MRVYNYWPFCVASYIMGLIIVSYSTNQAIAAATTIFSIIGFFVSLLLVGTTNCTIPISAIWHSILAKIFIFGCIAINLACIYFAVTDTLCGNQLLYGWTGNESTEVAPGIATRVGATLISVAVLNWLLIIVTTTKIERALHTQNVKELNKLLTKQPQVNFDLKELATLSTSVLASLPDNMFSKSLLKAILMQDTCEFHDLGKVRNIISRIGMEHTVQMDSTYLGDFAKFGSIDYCNPTYVTASALVSINSELTCPLLQLIECLPKLDKNDRATALLPIVGLDFPNSFSNALDQIRESLEDSAKIYQSKLQLSKVTQESELDIF